MQRPPLRRLLLLTALALLAVGLIAAKLLTDPHVALNPGTAKPAQEVTVIGSGFPPDVDGTLTLQGPTPHVVRFRTIASGSFSTRLIVPDTTTAGVYKVEATVGGATATSALEVTGTPTATADAPVLIAAGDIASCSEPADSRTADLVSGISGTVIVAGDLAYNSGTAKQFADCYDPTWGRFRDRTRPVPGNHEYGTPRAAGYFEYFGAAAGAINRGYYAFDIAGWRVYALNSNCAKIGGCGIGSLQQQWLAADLRDHPTQCVAAYWHHPVFSSGVHGNDPTMKDIFRTLYNAGAEVVINGHDHDYERFAPQDPSAQADPAFGIREFVVGTGGKNHYRFHAIRSNSEVRDQPTFGVLKLTLGKDAYRWDFVPVAGQTFTDSGTGTCHDAPPSGSGTPRPLPSGGPSPSETILPGPSESDPS